LHIWHKTSAGSEVLTESLRSEFVVEDKSLVDDLIVVYSTGLRLSRSSWTASAVRVEAE
jgi:hypothetical protein